MTFLAATDTPILTERRSSVLRYVVQEYIRTAQPVASATISLGVSPATIRNELSALEALGLLTHPHTSAGRVPTDAGYRYFVQHLMAESELNLSERSQIRGEFTSARNEMDQRLQVSTAVLARTAQSAALATAPRSARSHYKHIELVAIHGVKVLLVLVLSDGTVRQQLLDLDQPVEQAELRQTSNELNDRLTAYDAGEVIHATAVLSPFARQVAILIADVMRRLDSEISGQLYRDGLAQVLEEPEFSEGDSVRRIVQVFEQRSILEQVMGELDVERPLHILIAGDGRVPELRDISLILGRYGATDGATGLLGVVGPMRMDYDRSVGAVRFVAGLMSEFVEESYGP
jgi:heat-inducible transcriptional repressor